MERKIITFGDYFSSFLKTIDEDVRRKLDYVLDMLKTVKRLNSKFVKPIRDGIFELRIEWEGDIYRVFFIFDEGNIVVLFNGFQKKTRKTSTSEIERAITIKRNTMNTKENKIKSYDAVLDERYGAVGTPEREAFRKEAYAYYMGQVIREARREEKITQTELGKRIGANKSYISRIENGLIDPTISTIYSIITALGLRIEIVRPVG